MIARHTFATAWSQLENVRYSDRCARYYIVMPTGCWRFLKSLETTRRILFAFGIACAIQHRQAKYQRIAAQKGPHGPARVLVTRARATKSAELWHDVEPTPHQLARRHARRRIRESLPARLAALAQENARVHMLLAETAA